jgi:hypothetical protein
LRLFASFNLSNRNRNSSGCNIFCCMVVTFCYIAFMFTREQSKVELKRRGWSYRSAAGEIGITYQHLSYVLNGHRNSRRVLKAIQALPKRRVA